MPVLETVDGSPVDAPKIDPAEVDRQFSRSMAADTPESQAPPRRQPAAVGSESDPKPKRSKPPKAEQARTTAAPPAVLTAGERAAGVKGLAQVGAGITLLFAKATGKDAFKADAVTIASSADEIADACVQVANADPKFAAALDKVCAVGPYGALITVMVGVATQCARNHRPSLNIPGTIDPAELLKAQNEAEKVNA